MKFQRIQSSFIFLLAFLALSSCTREFDSPPVQEIPVGDIVTCAEVRSMFTGTPVRITEDKTVFGVITMDETNGNFYKEAYMQDATGSLYLRLTSPGGLYKGDSIRLNLNGVTLQDFNGMFQVDSVNTDNNIVKLATLIEVEPTVLTIDQLGDTWEGYLIQLDSVQFAASELNQTYADAVSQFSENRILEDCNGNTIIVRNSGYSNFAGDTLPSGKGTFIGILGEFSPDFQLYVRDPNELTMTGTRCGGGGNGGGYLSKDFEDQSLTSGGWSTQVVTGTDDWYADVFSNDWFAKMSNYDGNQNNPSETWLISPAMDLSGATNPILNFNSACNYSGANLEVKVSKNYTGSGDPTAGFIWVDLQATLSPGQWAWTDSGDLSLANYKNAGVYVAFVYKGSATDGKTWEIDNISVTEQ